ncbi:GRASP55/65 PDZ-like domain-containing protein [Dipodascopsis tothii]|uniref:GRASP55/65 PDZ-like domain-containing protein n=1 Tax=Dipodascopsis tothii TaxID=44089 RepID=UPI0034CD2597
MGNEQSFPSFSADAIPLSYGFRVLKVKANTIASNAGLESYFDYICGINGRQIEDGDVDNFVQEIRNCAGASVKFTVFSAKGQKLRDITLLLEGDGSNVDIGLSLQWTPLSFSGLVWHVLNVYPQSPAFDSHLVPESDYIVGIQGHYLPSEGSLGEVLEKNINSELTLYVYNHDFNTVRLTLIKPARDWGDGRDRGVLGCGIGFGYLHRLPEWVASVPMPGETIFAAQDETDAVDNDSQKDLQTAASSTEGGMLVSAVPMTETEAMFRQLHVGASEIRENHRTSKATSPRKKFRPGAVSSINYDQYFEEERKRPSENAEKLRAATGEDVSPPPKDSELLAKETS